MIKKAVVMSGLFLSFSVSLNGMQFKWLAESTTTRLFSYGLSSSAAGIGALCLCNSKNHSGDNLVSSLCFLTGLQFLTKETSIKQYFSSMLISVFTASVVAGQTRDRNRTTVDHLRALCAGGLLAGGLWEFSKNLYLHNIKESSIGLGVGAVGALLLSQKDIKTFFGRQRGNSLNPPADLKEYIKKDRNHSEEKVEILRSILEVAQEGEREAKPFCYRIASFLVDTFKKENTDLKNLKIWITRLDLVTKVLPYLRTDIELTGIETAQDPLTVYSTDHDSSKWMRKESIDPYLTLASFKLSKGIQ